MMTGPKKTGFMVLAFVAVVLVGVVLTNEQKSGPGSPEPVDFIFSWTAPTTGTPVVSYDIEIRRGGSDSTDVTSTTSTTTEITVEVTNFLVKYEVRVRGVDAQGRRGPWTKWSLEYDRGLPEAADL